MILTRIKKEQSNFPFSPLKIILVISLTLLLSLSLPHISDIYGSPGRGGGVGGVGGGVGGSSVGNIGGIGGGPAGVGPGIKLAQD